MEPITQAIVLAGGRAERLRPYSDSQPKAVMSVGGLALITRQLVWLAREGMREVVISSGYLHRQISEYVGGGDYYGMTVRHAVDPRPLGTAGAVRFAHNALPEPNRPFLVLNGSVLTDMPIQGLIRRHEGARATVTMALVRYQTKKPVAEESEDGRIRGLPQISKLPYWIDAGVWIYQPYAVKMLPEQGDLADVYEPIAAKGLLSSFRAPDDCMWAEIENIGDVYHFPDPADDKE